MRWAEVAPAAPLLIDALPALLALAGLIVALGLVLLIDGFVRALFGAIASFTSIIPGVGSLTSSAIHNAEHAISNALGNAIAGIESRIAHQFHNLARVAARLWHAIEGAAELIFALATLAGAAVTLPILHHLTRPIYRQIARAEHTALRAIHHAIAVAEAFTHSVAQGVYPRLRTLEHEVTRTLPREIRSARALAREAEDGVARLWKAVRALPGIDAVDAAVAAAIAALGLVGLDLLRCAEAGNLFSRRGCGLWNALDDLLGLLLDAVLFVDLCNLLPELETLFAELEAPLVSLIATAADAACAHPSAGWVELAAPALSLPTVYYTGPVPGN